MGQSVPLCSCGSTQESVLKLFIAVAKAVTEVTPTVIVAIVMTAVTVTADDSSGKPQTGSCFANT